MPKKVAILKAGTFIDSSGKEHTFTEKDLDAIAAKYNPANHEAPEVIGHPKNNAPAWGWVQGLQRKGDLLFYEPKDRVPEFQEMIDKKMFKKRSLSLYPDMTLRHVGWLGAQPPAIKGLPDPATFAEGEEFTIEFSEAYAINTIGNIFQRFREWLIAKFDQDTADRIVDNWDIDQLKNLTPDDAVPAETSLYTEKPQGEDIPPVQKEVDMAEKPTIEELQQQLADANRKISEFSEKDKTKDARIHTLEADGRRREFAAFCDSDEMKEKITPAMKPAVMDFMDILSGVETYEFSEGEGKVKKPPAEAFKGFLKTLPKAVDFAEHAIKDKATDKGAQTAEMKLDAKAREKMSQDKNLTYSAAFSEAQQENRELAAEYADEIRGGK